MDVVYNQESRVKKQRHSDNASGRLVDAPADKPTIEISIGERAFLGESTYRRRAAPRTSSVTMTVLR